MCVRGRGRGKEHARGFVCVAKLTFTFRTRVCAVLGGLRDRLVARVAEEIEIERCGGVFGGTCQSHSHYFLVEV